MPYFQIILFNSFSNLHNNSDKIFGIVSFFFLLLSLAQIKLKPRQAGGQLGLQGAGPQHAAEQQIDFRSLSQAMQYNEMCTLGICSFPSQSIMISVHWVYIPFLARVFSNHNCRQHLLPQLPRLLVGSLKKTRNRAERDGPLSIMKLQQKKNSCIGSFAVRILVYELHKIETMNASLFDLLL